MDISFRIEQPSGSSNGNIETPYNARVVAVPFIIFGLYGALAFNLDPRSIEKRVRRR
jgi:hypothetical protein